MNRWRSINAGEHLARHEPYPLLRARDEMQA